MPIVMGMAYPEISFILVVASFGLVYAIALTAFYIRLNDKPKLLMSNFKLNQDKTVRDFKLFLIANIGITACMALLGAGSYFGSDLLMNVSYFGQVIFSALVVGTVITWVIEYVF